MYLSLGGVIEDSLSSLVKTSLRASQAKAGDFVLLSPGKVEMRVLAEIVSARVDSGLLAQAEAERSKAVELRETAAKLEKIGSDSAAEGMRSQAVEAERNAQRIAADAPRLDMMARAIEGSEEKWPIKVGDSFAMSPRNLDDNAIYTIYHRRGVAGEGGAITIPGASEAEAGAQTFWQRNRKKVIAAGVVAVVATGIAIAVGAQGGKRYDV